MARHDVRHAGVCFDVAGREEGRRPPRARRGRLGRQAQVAQDALDHRGLVDQRSQPETPTAALGSRLRAKRADGARRGAQAPAFTAPGASAVRSRPGPLTSLRATREVGLHRPLQVLHIPAEGDYAVVPPFGTPGSAAAPRIRPAPDGTPFAQSVAVADTALDPPSPNPRVVEPSSPRLLDRVRAATRLRHHSLRTERASVAWIRRFIVFHGERDPRELGERR